MKIEDVGPDVENTWAESKLNTSQSVQHLTPNPGLL